MEEEKQTFSNEMEAAEPYAKAVDDAPVEELTFDQKFEQACTIMRQNPNFRQVMYKLLKLCNDGVSHPLPELENFVAGQPGYGKLRQPPFFPIHWLCTSYALDEYCLDAQGCELDHAYLAELTEDEFDDAVDQFAYRTSDVGRSCLEEFDPKKWIRVVLDEAPERYGIYLDLLDFLRESHGLAEVDRRIRTSESFIDIAGKGDIQITPGMFIDKLNSVGGITYDGGWKITEEGEELLELLEMER